MSSWKLRPHLTDWQKELLRELEDSSRENASDKSPGQVMDGSRSRILCRQLTIQLVEEHGPPYHGGLIVTLTNRRQQLMLPSL
ncbi:hypothetical protein [Propionivibrio sp.]|uniref:hypothetical protein n=1 Tax=Propionivibrio sp. TaxID=2212460 RepID=UPI0025EDA192|nr:hypothetical protein [Propionivibrio sp.]